MNRSFHEMFPVTTLLLVVIGGCFALQVLAEFKVADSPEQAGVFSFRTMGPYWLGALHTRALPREPWLLLTCVFLHGGAIHLFFNAQVLWSLGVGCEPLLSSYRFFTVFVVCGLGGSLLSWAWSGVTGTPRISVGASGALLGCIGLLLVFSMRHGLFDLRQQIVRWLITIGILSVILWNRIDHTGHLGGFLAGALFGRFTPRYTTSREAERWRIPAYLCGAVVAASLAMGVWGYFERLRDL